MRTIQITALALIVGAGVACKSKSDSGESGVTAGTTGSTGTTGGSSVGDGTGTHGVTIQEAGCSVGWDLAGAYTGTGADYSWAATLTLNAGLTDCANATDTTGTITASGGSAYWNATEYIGAASYSGTTLSWATNGYVTGSGGYTYAYDGNITW